MIRILCPGTMARHLLTPIIAKFVVANPALRIDLETYSPRSDPGSRMDVDVIFTVSSPNDSSRRVRSYPGTARGLFASPQYVREYGRPNNPNELPQHRCIGIFSWKLTSGENMVIPELVFHIETGDPVVSKQLALDGVGITVLPLWMARSPELREALEPVLPEWTPSPIPLYALYSGPNVLTPKIKILLDFLAHYIGTDRDPRLDCSKASECFTNPRLNTASLQ
jgi:LysR family transcriptional regulator, transcriptional activator for dmlA